MTIGARLRQLRLSKKLTQEALGDICGVTKGMVSQWESDQVVPPSDRLLLLKAKLNYSIDWLLTGEPITTEDQREDALLKLYRASDDRGKTTIIRAAEQESQYLVSVTNAQNGTN